MSAFHHWQPVLPSHQLRQKPVAVRVCGREIVLFRGKSGVLGALDNVCPHRRMRLDHGWVEEDRLVCRYHGLALAPDGQGSSSFNRNLKPCARSYDITERWGALWLKSRESAASLPDLDIDGFGHCTKPAYHVIKAPLELCLDNFAEIEHAATTHFWLGYDHKGLADVEQDVEMDEETITVCTLGVQREVPKPMQVLFGLFGLRPGDLFEDRWTHHFAPVYTIYRHRWLDPRTREPRPKMQFRFAIFMTPVDDESTALFSFLYLPHTMMPFRRILEPVQLFISHTELKQDQKVLENLADKSPELRGMKLGRFDKTLGEIRKRLDTIYRAGRTSAPGEATAHMQ